MSGTIFTSWLRIDVPPDAEASWGSDANYTWVEEEIQRRVSTAAVRAAFASSTRATPCGEDGRS
jgi:hypothetical protein